MIAFLSIMASVTAVIFLIIGSRFGVRYLVAVKGIIDAGWSAHFVGMLNAPRLVGGLAPLILLPKIFSSAKEEGGFFSLPLSKLATIYLISCTWGALMMVGGESYMGSINYYLRMLNGFLGFFMFQVFFHDRDTFKNLLVALLICGLFPMVVGLHGAVTGKVWGEARQAAGLVRNVGVYHDAVAIRMYAFLTLTGILLFWQYFKPKVFKKLLLLAYVAVCCIVIYKTYSKSAIMVFILWGVIWTVFNKKFGLLLLLPVVLVVVNFAMDNRIFDEVIQAFSKETASWSGEIDERYRFSGRTILWNDLISDWEQQDTVVKMFGGRSVPAHNEYLRILLVNGLFGLFVYVFMYISIGIMVFINTLKRTNPLNVMALMLFAMLSLDNIGITPGMYPVYQWQVWGFIGLSLHGLAGMSDNIENEV